MLTGAACEWHPGVAQGDGTQDHEPSLLYPPAPSISPHSAWAWVRLLLELAVHTVLCDHSGNIPPLSSLPWVITMQGPPSLWRISQPNPQVEQGLDLVVANS